MNQHLYEYAIIRYVPRVEREEFINVGLVMVCKRARWIEARVGVAPERLAHLPHAHCREEILQQLRTFTATAAGTADAGPIGLLEPEERFRWLTAVKSSCLQTSRPHPGLTDNLQAEFDRLYAQYVD